MKIYVKTSVIFSAKDPYVDKSGNAIYTAYIDSKVWSDKFKKFTGQPIRMSEGVYSYLKECDTTGAKVERPLVFNSSTGLLEFDD